MELTKQRMQIENIVNIEDFNKIFVPSLKILFLLEKIKIICRSRFAFGIQDGNQKTKFFLSRTTSNF